MFSRQSMRLNTAGKFNLITSHQSLFYYEKAEASRPALQQPSTVVRNWKHQ